MERTKPKESNLFQSNVIVTTISVAAMGLSFVNQIVIAAFYGTSVERDIYFAAISIPTVLTAVYVGSIGVNFIPLFSEIYQKHGLKKAESFFNSSISWTFIIISSLSIIIIYFEKGILGFLFDNVVEKDNGLILVLSKILIPTFLIQSINLILSYFLNVKGYFLIPSIIKLLPIISSIIMVVLFNDSIGIPSLAYGFLLGNIASGVVLIFFILAYRLSSYKFSLKFTSMEILRLSTPLFFANVLYRSSTLVERSIASGIGDGAISYLGYSNQLVAVMIVVTSGGIGTVLFPLFAKKWYSKELDDLNKLVEKSIIYILLIGIPLAIYVLFFGQGWIMLLFQRGAFDSESSHYVSVCLSLLMGHYLASSLGEIIAKHFYYSKKTRLIATIDIITSTFYFILIFAFGRHYGAFGLALSLSLSGILHSFVLLKVLGKIIPNFQLKLITRKVVLYVLNSLFVGGILSFILPIKVIFNLQLPLTIISYFGLLYILLKYLFNDSFVSTLSKKTIELIQQKS